MTQEATSAAAAAPDLQSLGERESKERFLAVVAEVIGVGQLDTNEHFLDAGGDSLSTAIIIDWIGKDFGVEPEFDWFFDSQTIKELVDRWWAKANGLAQPAPAAAPGQ
jgi:acyl carrier protein